MRIGGLFVTAHTRGRSLGPGALALCALVALGCTGVIGSNDENGSGDYGPNGPHGSSGSSGSGGALGETPDDWMEQADPNAATMLPLRMITKTEYDHTIAVIFADEYGVVPSNLRPASVLPGEAIDRSGFLAIGEFTELHAARFGEAAAAVTAAIGGELSRLVGCDLATVSDDVGCIRGFLPAFGELVYRRPLEQAEIDEHVAFYQYERESLGQTPDAAARQLIEAMLQSPHFLYRWEDGWKVSEQQGDVVRLNPYQVASRLSFFLWSSGPDRALLDLAKQGGLSTPEQTMEQARLMLESPRAERALDSLHSQWFGLAGLDSLFKDENRFPEWSDALSSAMRSEMETFTRTVLLEGDGSLTTLLTAPYSYINEDLARVYGISGVQGTELRQVQLDATQRAGLLTMPGLLAVSSEASVPNPFRRGKLILDKVMCQSLEPPAIIPVPPEVDPDDPRSERQILEELTGEAPCSTCHVEINPLGFGLHNFDAIGRYRTVDERGKPVDASGVLPDSAVAFSGPAELAVALANSEQVQACFAKQWFRFALARHEEGEDAHSLSTAYQAFAASGFNIREMVARMVTTRSFLYRKLEAGEVVEVAP